MICSFLSLLTSIVLLHHHHLGQNMHHHHQPLKSNLADLGTERKTVESQPLCPKPRKLSPSIPEFLKPIKCNKHSHSNVNNGSQVLDMISEKNADGREFLCNGCLPCCYSGSPPRRTENPLVHDVQFLHQVEVVSPLARAKLSDKFGFISASPM